MSLFLNAIDAIRVGVADFAVGDHARLLAAVRGLHAGVLLLFKEALHRLSPAGTNDVLVRAQILPRRDASGAIVFIGAGRRTVDGQAIRQRFESLGIATDWERFERVSKVRNDVEHYFTDVTKNSLCGLVSDCFILARDFLVNELHEDPRQSFGDESWNQMLAVSDVYERERIECRKSLDSIDWQSPVLSDAVAGLTCEQCGSGLLSATNPNTNYSDVGIRCRVCGAEEQPDSFIGRAIESHLGADIFCSIKDGGESPVVLCPECARTTFIVDEWKCAYCGESPSRHCLLCDMPIPPEELGLSGMCSYCHHVSTKDD